jgi:ADP-ribose pyrophosphatase YjhB (NUDIX family)
MTNNSYTITVRLRAIIIHAGKLLVVTHAGNGPAMAIPGGKLEFGEDIRKGLEREVVEELGVMPVLGRLLYTNNWSIENEQNIEFFFEVKNGKDYADTSKLKGTHSFELAEILWLSRENENTLLPKQLGDDFKNGSLLEDTVRFIYN